MLRAVTFICAKDKNELVHKLSPFLKTTQTQRLLNEFELVPSKTENPLNSDKQRNSDESVHDVTSDPAVVKNKTITADYDEEVDDSLKNPYFTCDDEKLNDEVDGEDSSNKNDELQTNLEIDLHFNVLRSLITQDWRISDYRTIYENQCESRRHKSIALPNDADVKKLSDFLSLKRAECLATLNIATDLSSHRENRQLPIPPNDQSLSSNPLLTGRCYTSKGVLGRCMSFRQCYPFFKIREFNNWDGWVLGMYDTCRFYTAQGRQLFGVCCTSPDQITSTSTTTLDTTEVTTDANLESLKKPNYPQVANWPPPLPTHPPHHTIPPLPTHPPSSSFGYPHPQPSPTPVQTQRPANPPVTPAPGWPPTHRPSKPPATPAPGWPPTHRPSKPPATPAPGWPPTQRPTTQAPVTNVPIADAACGAKNGYQDQERIVGGHNADLGEWPWIAGLFNGGRQFCGGSLIDNIHILSAAHCVAHMSSWDVARLTVRLGDHNIKIDSEVKHIEKKVKRVVRHRGFDSRTLYNDVSILTMDSPVAFTHQVRPICLPRSTGESHEGKTGTVIGWGSIRESGPQPQVLQEVNIPIWSNTNCRRKYGPAAPGGIVDHMLCAGQANRDSCSGDSGGPLMINDGKWTQVGIVSWGIGCGKGQYPGVYTRVQTFLPWIKKNIS
ncbi:hypothetical protein FQA39_LY14149 [Lamprigera yunnana]|nr:hypothetical protein FQA39_LY14149 [Lamprigera yunnana]